MSELQVIETVLNTAARRRRLSLAFRGMWKALLAGAVCGLVVLAAYKLAPLPPETLLLVPAVPLLAAIIGFIAGGWRKPKLSEMARYVDSRENLKERLSTALEVTSRPEVGRWGELVVKDAATHAKHLEGKALIPLALSRAPRWALLVLAIVAGLGFVPEYRSKDSLRKEQDKVVISQVGKQLTELTRRNLEKRPPALEPTEKAMTAVSELGDRLAKASLTRGEALKDIANVAERLKDEVNQLSRDPALKRLEQAARTAGSVPGETQSSLQKQIEALQKQLGAPTGHPDALDKLRQALEKLQQTAIAQARNEGGASDSERKQMSSALSALSRDAQDMGMQIPSLEGAIEALAANQPDLFLKNLQASLNDLEKMRDMAKNLQQLQQQMEKLGKDLPEQLQRGQPEMAEQTLRKMMQQLNSANLPSEQLQKLMQEISKAIPPAGNYGEVASHLKSAAQSMKAGQLAAASGSLGKAADELQKLMQQMGDSEALMAELQSLNEASMCIANGQCWGMGKPGRPGYKPTDKPGSGVGTWAENESMDWTGEMSDGWDNSGIVREDMDARGITDRDPTLNEALKPTKVKGQFTPGSQMPSITLKGLSIKGQSSVEYEAAAAAAQSDAESALSQEKVPRAYQNAVKDYFDDLK